MFADCSHVGDGIRFDLECEGSECVTERFSVVVAPQVPFEILSSETHRTRSAVIGQKTTAIVCSVGLSSHRLRTGDRVETLEDENEQLRAENEALRERVAAIEAELGLDATADRQGVADD